MKKGEVKIIKDKNKPEEVVIAEKVIDTKKKSRQIDNRPIWEAIQAVESRVSKLEKINDTLINQVKDGFEINGNLLSKIMKKVNQLSTRLGLTEL